jgi:hypothetical protein
VASIGTSSFYGCYTISFITIPSGVESLGVSSFKYCYSLYGITLPSSLLTILNDAFSTCYSLSIIIIPSGVTSIGYNCFNTNVSLSSVTYTGTIATAEIHSDILKNCEQLKILNWPGLKTTRFGLYGVAGKINKLGSAGNIAGDSIPIRLDWANSTFASTTAPQLDLSYCSMDTTQMQKLFRCLPTVGAPSSNTKQVTVTGNTGSATLSQYAKDIAIAKGWQVNN